MGPQRAIQYSRWHVERLWGGVYERQSVHGVLSIPRQFALWAGGTCVPARCQGKFLHDREFCGGPTQINACCGLDSKLFGYYPDLEYSPWSQTFRLRMLTFYASMLERGVRSGIECNFRIAPMHRVHQFVRARRPDLARVVASRKGKKLF